jgi:carbon-monoxide dehydrogenase medium subunit
MLPPRFDYVAPSSMEEVLSLLQQHGEEAKVIGGGQSLIPLMKLRLAAPRVLVDLRRLPGLSFVVEVGGGLRIGAMTRTAEMERSDVVTARWPLVAAAAPLISDPLIRNLGTVGGSLAHADPAGDWGSVMLALGAEVVAERVGGERTIPMAEFFRGTFETALEPTELLTEIRVPAPAGKAGGTYLKLERKVGDYATVATATQVELEDGRMRRAGVALTAVGSQNLRSEAAEQVLEGAEPTAEALDEAARLAAADARPFSDVRGSAEYKREVARVFVRRGLERALEIARQG